MIIAAATTLLPLPDKRQDLLRLVLRYSDVVLSHPSCSVHIENVLEGLRHTFTKRITSKSEKNLSNVIEQITSSHHINRESHLINDELMTINQ